MFGGFRRRSRRTLCCCCCSLPMDVLIGLILMTVLQLMFKPSGIMADIKITRMRMPAPVENGTMPAVIVDCEYTYEDSDLESIVVKWFFNKVPEPIYQWIPPQPPESLGILATRLDLKYRISEDNYTMHRALRILWPTVDLSGNYRCQVSSLGAESEESKQMIVYVPATAVEVNYTKPTEYTVNVTCMATRIYPVPEAFILVHRGNSRNPEMITDGITSVTSNTNDDGSYNAILHREFEDQRLTPSASFECVFAIPGSDYNATERITYYPGLPSVTTTHPSSTPVLLLKDLISTESSRIDPNVASTKFDSVTLWSSMTSAIFILIVTKILNRHS